MTTSKGTWFACATSASLNEAVEHSIVSNMMMHGSLKAEIEAIQQQMAEVKKNELANAP
jgi:hypothetical protein